MYSNKKAKMEDNNNNKNNNNNNNDNNDDDAAIFAKVKEYLLSCPQVSADHPAIQAALRGIVQEEQRRARDAKLKEKFAKATKKTENPQVVNVETEDSADHDLEVVDYEKEESRHMSSSSDPPMSGSVSEGLVDDWHEVPADASPLDDTAATLGEVLAQASIKSLARHQVQVRQPWQALLVALHGALRSDVLGFRCTGKEEEQNSAGGFAPPVRELPSTQFLPTNLWGSSNQKQAALRYRKAGTGSVVLTVKLVSEDSNEEYASITFGPSKSPESMTEPLLVKIADHVNLDSWTKASTGGKMVPPSLHYKHLSAFLRKFCQRFDLGAVQDSTDVTMTDPVEALPYVDRTIATLARPVSAPAVPTTVPPYDIRPIEPWMREQYYAPTIDSAFGLRIPNHGDFAGDLVPGGFNVDPLHGGNLMGPNHPMFLGGAGSHGMTPRFDPFGPPQPDTGGTRGGGPNTGRPNPDHMRPPNNLNNNMFM